MPIGIVPITPLWDGFPRGFLIRLRKADISKTIQQGQQTWLSK
jgi:hypothetical protein